jgi:hypothetical protein
MFRNVLIVISFLGLITVAGCGGDDDNGGGSGVASDKKVNALSQAELDQICKSRTDKFNSLTSRSTAALASYANVACVAFGLGIAAFRGDAGTKELCETSRDQCLANIQTYADAGASNAGTGTTSACPTVATVATCDALVSEVDACTTAQVAAWSKYIDDSQKAINDSALTCDKVGQMGDLSAYADAGATYNAADASIPQCSALTTKCTFLEATTTN